MKINGMPTAHMAQQKYIKIKYEAKKNMKNQSGRKDDSSKRSRYFAIVSCQIISQKYRCNKNRSQERKKIIKWE